MIMKRKIILGSGLLMIAAIYCVSAATAAVMTKKSKNTANTKGDYYGRGKK